MTTDTSAPVLIKTLIDDDSAYAECNDILSEWLTAAKLQDEFILLPDQLTEVDGKDALVYFNCKGMPLPEVLLSGPLEHRLFVRAAIGMTQAVRRLHLRKLAHSSLTPSAFFIDCHTPAVQLTNLFAVVPLAHQDNSESNSDDSDTHGVQSNLYSLGRLFYYMATGTELLAQGPQIDLPVDSLNQIPNKLASIIVKCIAPAVEERYPSAYALLKELNDYEQELEASEAVYVPPHNPFDSLGQLYEREDELQRLLHAYQRVSMGFSELVLLRGSPGTGKSALIQQFQKALPSDAGLLLFSKQEHYFANVAFAALRQMLETIHQFLYALPEQQLSDWKQALLTPFGLEQRAIADIRPMFDVLFDPQHLSNRLSPPESTVRTRRMLHQLIQVLIEKGKPLVMVMDDFHWTDTASLQLIQEMILSEKHHGVLFIAAYREDEQESDHPLHKFTASVEAAKDIHKTTISLSPLSIDAVEALLQDTLKPKVMNGRLLADIIMKQTKGNPFFTKHFLRFLIDQQSLTYNPEQSAWSWKYEDVSEIHISDHANDFMMKYVSRLPERMKKVLMLAACIGNPFPVDILMSLMSEDSLDVAAILAEAAAEGLIQYMAGHETDEGQITSCKFVHDQLHQAFYSLASCQQKQRLHISIGSLLLQKTKTGDVAPLLFDIVNQLNDGSEAIIRSEDRMVLAALNLAACRKAKSSGSYEQAYLYANTGLRIADTLSSDPNSELMYTLRIVLAELRYLCGDLEQAEQEFQLLLPLARTKWDAAEIYNQLILIYTSRGDYEQAITTGKTALRLFHIQFPDVITRRTNLWELFKSRWRIGGRKPFDLLNAPELKRHELLAVHRLFVALAAPTYYSDTSLHVYLMLKMVNFSLVHGHAEGSSLAYAFYGSIYGTKLGRIDTGWEYGQLALALSDKFNHTSAKCKLHFIYGLVVSNMKQPVSAAIRHLEQAYHLGSDSGDYIYAGNAVTYRSLLMIFRGDPLTEVMADSEQYHSFLFKTQEHESIQYFTLLQRFMHYLSDAEETCSSFSQSDSPVRFMEEEEIAKLKQFSNKAPIITYYSFEALLSFLMNDFGRAKVYVELNQQYLPSPTAFLHTAVHCFFTVLITSEQYAGASPALQKKYRSETAKALRYLDHWSTHSPDNFLHLKLFAEAEALGMLGKSMQAAEKYDEVVRQTDKNNNLPYKALACERAARLFLKAGREQIGYAYLNDALTYYKAWGAQRISASLEKQFPLLRAHEVLQEGTNQRLGSTELTAAINTDPAFRRLVESMMKIMQEQTSADRVVLFIASGGQLQAMAEKLHNDPLFCFPLTPLEDMEQIAVAPIRYAARTGETVYITDAATSILFSRDPYIRLYRPSSLLCIPIQQEPHLIGLLYFEKYMQNGSLLEADYDVLEVMSASVISMLRHPSAV